MFKRGKLFSPSILAVVMVVFLLISQTAVFATDGEVPTRDQVDDKYKMDLTKMYPNRGAFEQDIKKVKEELIPKIKEYKGKLNNVDSIYEYFELESQISQILNKAYWYGNLQLDLNQNDTDAQEMVSIAGGVWGIYGEAISFERPELLSMPTEKFQQIMNDPKLSTYKHYLEKMLKEKDHVLSNKEERILSLSSDLTGSPEDIFNKVMYADFEYPTIKDKEGNEITLINSVYYKILEGDDRELRKKASKARIEALKKRNNTLAATYISEIKKNIFLAKARGYNSSLEASLAAKHIPKSIYDNLVKSVNNNLEYLHKYNEVKSKALGIKDVKPYDWSLPIVGDYKMELTYEEAVELANKGLEPLGEKYLKDFNTIIDSRLIDVYSGKGKQTGAYSLSLYGCDPYISMNYTNDLDSALTLSHEMGHSLNGKYSMEQQELYNSNTSTFTAEVASTANELLVMDYLIKNAKSDEEKLFLLNQQINNIRGTIYTQVMFAEFEQRAHEMVEQGQPLSAEVINNLWLEIRRKYNGEAYPMTEDGKYSWSRIPHFYMNFYVYNYATSMSASYQLVNNITEGKEGAVQKYIEFLGAGGSDYPVEILKKAGVDMNSSEPVDNILKYFGELVDEMEKLLEKRAQETENTDTAA
ncbi:oligoendopeptidase F [Dethiothermospora halolimnae]|uniref:oligoendopeptidase F n=1 Tax=Dethiothermospora halolimnae TaxID=3114390 RepID=UPI003CCB792E